MKNWLSSRLGFVAMAFLLATAVSATADLDALTKAKVIRIKGSARFTTGTGSWQPLKVGDVLSSGTVIQTAADSRVDLILGDTKATAAESKMGVPFGSAAPGGGGGAGSGSPGEDINFVRLMENTVLSVDKLSATDTGADIVTDTQLDLRAGRIFGTVKKLTSGSRYEVKIPNGVAGVRGTVYMLSAQGDCMIYKGAFALALQKSDGSIVRRDVKTNQKYDPRTDSVTDLSADDQKDIISNTRSPQQNVQVSSPFAPAPPKRSDEPFISPTTGDGTAN